MIFFTGKTYIVLIGVVIAIIFILFYSSEKGNRPDNPMQLFQKPCPETPNCILTKMNKPSIFAHPHESAMGTWV